MSLKIIGAGYGRTGTLSTKSALNHLGFNCYHMEEVLNVKKNKGHMDFWVEVSQLPSDTSHDWSKVFENYAATVDNPSCCVWQELYETYPDAKVLLTLHPKGPEAWYKSTMNTIYFSQISWEYSLLIFFIPTFRKMKTLARDLIWRRSHRGTMDNKAAAIERYAAHIEEVKSIVPSDKLLIFSVDQGWGPLCAFLGVAVPDIPFPRKNDTKEFRKRIKTMKGLAYGILLLGFILIVGLMYIVMV